MTSFCSSWVNGRVSCSQLESLRLWNVPMNLLHICFVCDGEETTESRVTNWLLCVCVCVCCIRNMQHEMGEDTERDTQTVSLSLSAALSASPLKVQSTAVGLMLYCSLKYYMSFLKTSWLFK